MSVTATANAGALSSRNAALSSGRTSPLASSSGAPKTAACEAAAKPAAQASGDCPSARITRGASVAPSKPRARAIAAAVSKRVPPKTRVTSTPMASSWSSTCWDTAATPPRIVMRSTGLASSAARVASERRSVSVRKIGSPSAAAQAPAASASANAWLASVLPAAGNARASRASSATPARAAISIAVSRRVGPDTRSTSYPSSSRSSTTPLLTAPLPPSTITSVTSSRSSSAATASSSSAVPVSSSGRVPCSAPEASASGNVAAVASSAPSASPGANVACERRSASSTGVSPPPAEVIATVSFTAAPAGATRSTTMAAASSRVGRRMRRIIAARGLGAAEARAPPAGRRPRGQAQLSSGRHPTASWGTGSRHAATGRPT